MSSTLEQNLKLVNNEKSNLNSTVKAMVEDIVGTLYSDIDKTLLHVSDYISGHQYVKATVGNSSILHRSTTGHIHEHGNKNVSITIYVADGIIYNAFVRNYCLPNIKQFIVSRSKT